MKGKLILIVIVSAVILIFAMIQISIYMNKDKTSENDLYQFDETEQEEEMVSGNGNDQSSDEVAEIGELDEEVQGEVLDFVEEEPQFPGGEAAMVQFIQENVQYPEIDREMGNQGTVYVQFVVKTTGEVSNVRVLKGTSSNTLNQEAVRVVKLMPDWIPAEQNGEKVNVRYQIPIKFTIQ